MVLRSKKRSLATSLATGGPQHAPRRVATACLAAAALLLGACGGAPEPAAAPGTTTNTAAVPSTAPGGAADPSFDDAAAVVRRWVAAVSAGDLDRAWALMSERAQQRAGGLGAFRAQEGRLVERWGAWASAPDVTPTVTSIVSSDREAALAVTLSGDLPAEDRPGREAAALAVRVVDGEARVEPSGADSGITLVRPSPLGGDALPPTPTFEAVVPAGAFAVFSVDGGDGVVAPTAPADGGRQRATLRFERPLPPGPHVLTVGVAVSPDGLGAAAAPFEVG